MKMKHRKLLENGLVPVILYDFKNQTVICKGQVKGIDSKFDVGLQVRTLFAHPERLFRFRHVPEPKMNKERAYKIAYSILFYQKPFF